LKTRPRLGTPAAPRPSNCVIREKGHFFDAPHIDADQLAAIAKFAKDEGKEFWYVFLEKPGRAVIDRIKQAGGKVSWFLDETDR
jgi:hypothetical protein